MTDSPVDPRAASDRPGHRGGRRPRGRRAGAGDRRRREGVAGRHDVRGDDLAPGAPRRPAPADAARAARLPGRELQPHPAVVRPRGRRRLRDHGAGRVPRDVRHEHDVRRDRPARDRDAADDRARHRADARGAGRADPRHGRRARDGKVTARHVPQRAGLRDAPRRAGRGAAPRHGHGRRGVRRDVLRHRRRRAVRAAAHARRGRRHRAHHRDDQGRRQRAAAGRPSRSSPGFAGITIGQLSGPAHDPANSLRNVVTVSTGTLDWERPATWTGAIDRSPCGTGTSARMATLHARGQLASATSSATRASSARSSPGACRGGATIGAYRAIVPTITGQAWITGFASYVVDPTDPFPDGFTVGDIW